MSAPSHWTWPKGGISAFLSRSYGLGELSSGRASPVRPRLRSGDRLISPSIADRLRWVLQINPELIS